MSWNAPVAARARFTSDGRATTVPRATVMQATSAMQVAARYVFERLISSSLDDRVDGVRDEAVRLAVDPVRRLGVGRVDQAEDPAGRLVDPVAEIANAVAI